MRIRALDSIRGLLLLQMTLDHFGRPISQYLYQCFGFFSAAEGFFFLSGFVGILAAASKGQKDPRQKWMRLRAFKTWRYHIVTLVALCIAARFVLPQVAYNFDTLYSHPVQGSLWSALLVYTPEWLDVLPLYVVFLLVGSFVFPLFLKANKKRTLLLLWFPSLALWVAAQFGLRDACNSIFPRWIHHGFFDPFGWQFVYFSGAAMSAWWRLARRDESAGDALAVRTVSRLTPAIIVATVFCFVWSRGILPLPMPVEFLTSKDHVGPLRFANFFIFMLTICWSVRRWPGLLDFKPTNLLGRHSLDVYTAHIVFIYLWMATPKTIRYQSPWNIVIPITACVLLWVIAKLREQR